MAGHPVRIVDPAGGVGGLRREVEALESAVVEISDDPVAAVQAHERAPAHLLVVREAAGDLDAMELAERVHEHDRENGHFTCVVLVTREDWPADWKAQRRPVVDLVLDEAAFARHGRTLLATALDHSERINRLLRDNRVLEQRCIEFQDSELTDTETGLGNGRYLHESLERTIAQIEARGGAVTVILLEVGGVEELRGRGEDAVAAQLVTRVAEKVRALVRPLDVVAHLGDGRFGLVLAQPDLETCHPRSYQRIFDGVRLKHFDTSGGYVNPELAMGFAASGADTGPPKPELLMRTAEEKLAESRVEGRICYRVFDPLGQLGTARESAA